MKSQWVVLIVVALGATALSSYAWYRSNDDECVTTWNYQVGAGVDTPEAAMEDLGVDPLDFDLADSSGTTRTFVNGSRTITVSQLASGWAVVTDSRVIRC